MYDMSFQVVGARVALMLGTPMKSNRSRVREARNPAELSQRSQQAAIRAGSVSRQALQTAARLTIIKLAVTNIARARSFYCDALGWQLATGSSDDLCFVQAADVLLALTASPSASVAVVDSHNQAPIVLHVSARSDVDSALARAVAGGGHVLRAAHISPSGYAARFVDLDGHTWEIVHLATRSRAIANENDRLLERFRQLMDVSSDATLLVSGEGRIVEANCSLTTLTGISREHLIGRSIERLLAEQLELVHQTIADAVATPTRLTHTLSARRADGSEFLADVTLASIATPVGQLIAITLRDATQRLRLAEAARQKSELALSMSHDLRTPLHHIMGYAELIHTGQAGPISDAQQDYLGDILSSSRKLLDVIDDVLEFNAGADAHVRLEQQPEVIALPTLVDEVRESLRAVAIEKRVSINATVAPALATVRLDRRMLRQVLYIYLSNAIRFSPTGAKVDVRVETEGNERFTIDVQDTGIGIASVDLPTLFADAPTPSGEEIVVHHTGTSLGLPLTRRIVESLDGEVGVYSVPGEGSTFWARLPRDVRVVTGATEGAID